MENLDLLRGHGLFNSKVPRYTSYPPANHFAERVGQDNQRSWLQAVPEDESISVYIHIPFCKRLCWFCACRTQGTKTLRPVDAYVDHLLEEISAVRARLPYSIKMARLHLGGGTPTILSPKTMTRLLEAVHTAFPKADLHEFSVEIDPTEASEDLLDVLIEHGLTRASLGVQDFALKVQNAIGRPQSLQQTRDVIDHLRKHGIEALNLDLLYGLPHQTPDSFSDTLDHVLGLQPDRMAIYGYAHVPWMSKRQVMIDDASLPDSETRFGLAMMAKDRLLQEGFRAVGIDHFATPQDALYRAQVNGEVRRNFQGYTDDQSQTLIGFGASAISKFRQGYLQNAVATSIYQDRISQTNLAGQKGYAMTQADCLIARIIEDLLCRFSVRHSVLAKEFPDHQDTIRAICVLLMQRFPDVFFISQQGFEMNSEARPLVRIIASVVDEFSSKGMAHSAAI